MDYEWIHNQLNLIMLSWEENLIFFSTYFSGSIVSNEMHKNANVEGKCNNFPIYKTDGVYPESGKLFAFYF